MKHHIRLENKLQRMLRKFNNITAHFDNRIKINPQKDIVLNLLIYD